MFKEFELGRVVATRGVMELGIDQQILIHLLARHANGDWGDVSRSDARLNDLATSQGDRLLSSYQLTPGITLWVITEWDRSATTILLPSEY